MAFGTSSKVMAYSMLQIAKKGIDLATDTCKVTLWTNTGTPANTVTTAAHASYKGVGGQWVVTNEVATATGYTRGGKTATKAVSQSSTHVKVTVTTLSWTSASFTTYGCALDDSTFSATTPLILAYFGFGAQTVTSGTLTLTFSSTGAIEFNC